MSTGHGSVERGGDRREREDGHMAQGATESERGRGMTGEEKEQGKAGEE